MVTLSLKHNEMIKIDITEEVDTETHQALNISLRIKLNKYN